MRLLFVFLVFWIMIMSATLVFRGMTGRERWAMTKIATFGLVTSIVTMFVLGAIVVFF